MSYHSIINLQRRCFSCLKAKYLILDGFIITRSNRLLETISRPITERLKWTLWFAAWGLVLIATLANKPAQVIMAPLFPLGLIAVFPNGKGIAIIAGTMVVPGLVSWVFYALLWKGISVAKKFHWHPIRGKTRG